MTKTSFKLVERVLQSVKALQDDVNTGYVPPMLPQRLRAIQKSLEKLLIEEHTT